MAGDDDDPIWGRGFIADRVLPVLGKEPRPLGPFRTPEEVHEATHEPYAPYTYSTSFAITMAAPVYGPQMSSEDLYRKMVRDMERVHELMVARELLKPRVCRIDMPSTLVRRLEAILPPASRGMRALAGLGPAPLTATWASAEGSVEIQVDNDLGMDFVRLHYTDGTTRVVRHDDYETEL